MKKLISLLLIAAVVFSMAVPAGAAFSDISDATTQKEVAVLQMMGVINGTSDTTFSPNGTLTRAQFCKMAVTLMGRADEEPLYRNRTIFPDVKSNHWARGYINLAVNISVGGTAGEDGQTTGGTKLIRGMGDGTFRPDRAITYAEAVTILLRVLGYSDADAGMNWPKGYLELGSQIGLTTGMNLSANQSLTRAQAAHLFSTMLTTPQKGGSLYYNALGSAQQDVVLMDNNAKADDGTTGAIRTSASETPIKTVSGVAPAELVGSRGTLITDTTGRAAAFIPTGSHKTITIGTAQAAWVTDRAGTRYNIPAEAPAYTTTENTTFDKLWMDLKGGSQLTLFYSDAGKVEGVYLRTVSADEAMVARQVSSGNPFAALLNGATNYTIYRDGNPASVGDIQAYDVGTYDPASRVLSVSSAKITGRYDNVWPNLQSPAKVTVLGAELDVLPMAMEDLAGFKLGDTITLLLTADGQVAGAVPSSTLRTDNVGVLEDEGIRLLNGILAKGEISGTAEKGELVRVTSTGAGKLSVSRVATSGAGGSLDVAGRKVGTAPLSGGCRLFEKVGNSAMREITFEDLTCTTVPSSKITYAHKDSGGNVDVLILNDVTGDLYTYGMLKNGTPKQGSFGGETYENRTIFVENSGKKNPGTAPTSKDTAIANNMAFSKNAMAGLIATADGEKIAGSIMLTEEKGVHRSDFTTRDGKVYVTLDSQEMRVSDSVQCYNKATGTWFDSLEDCRAFSDNLTVYYDRPVQDGGKVRVVVAQ